VETKIIETHGAGNWGKFLVARFTDEREYVSALPEARGALPLARWHPSTLLVLDLATGEGALFTPWGWHIADLRKHQVWVCPMFEGFLGWLYAQHLEGIDLVALPPLVHLPDNEFSLAGRRRHGLVGEAQELLADAEAKLPDAEGPVYDLIAQARELLARAYQQEWP
jgi:hypothetical protein